MRLYSFVALALWLGSFSTRASAEEPLSYNKDIRPILAANCFACHGPDSASRKADLRLDQREVAHAMEAIVPGKPDESALIQRMISTDPEQVMPPPVCQEDDHTGPNRNPQTLGRGRGSVSASLVVHPAGQSSRADR